MRRNKKKKKKKKESSTERGILPSIDESGSDPVEATEEEEDSPVEEEVFIAENETTAEEAAGEIETWTLIQVRWNVFAFTPSSLHSSHFPDLSS